MVSTGQLAARKMMVENGISDPNQIPIELIAAGLGATIVVKDLINTDGRIVFGERRALITVNSGIEYEGKRRFTIAHEIGHLILHKDSFQIHNDTDATLEYFKKGHQETEANEFASELLMPELLFRQISDEYEFSPALLKHLAEYFNTSITSVAYRYFKYGNHPICIIYTYNNIVKYWLRPEPYDHFLKDRTRLAPPDDSVAAEYFKTGKIYASKFSKQQIWKSTWFELKNWERDEDFRFYEYCIITPKYNTVLSIVWQE
jgi:Zn-dependent peptidase ImmA (M78 family)